MVMTIFLFITIILNLMNSQNVYIPLQINVGTNTMLKIHVYFRCLKRTLHELRRNVSLVYRSMSCLKPALSMLQIAIVAPLQFPEKLTVLILPAKVLVLFVGALIAVPIPLVFQYFLSFFLLYTWMVCWLLLSSVELVVIGIICLLGACGFYQWYCSACTMPICAKNRNLLCLCFQTWAGAQLCQYSANLLL